MQITTISIGIVIVENVIKNEHLHSLMLTAVLKGLPCNPRKCAASNIIYKKSDFASTAVRLCVIYERAKANHTRAFLANSLGQRIVCVS